VLLAENIAPRGAKRRLQWGIEDRRLLSGKQRLREKKRGGTPNFGLVKGGVSGIAKSLMEVNLSWGAGSKSPGENCN